MIFIFPSIKRFWCGDKVRMLDTIKEHKTICCTLLLYVNEFMSKCIDSVLTNVIDAIPFRPERL
jgi:hypothetical protein